MSYSLFMVKPSIMRPLLLCLAFALPSYAKWAEEGDMPFKTLSRITTITVNEKGTSETIITRLVKVLNEKGRQALTAFILPYKEPFTQTVIEAKTIIDGKEYPARGIEDKPLASTPSAFDMRRQTMISFDNLIVGGCVLLKTKLNQSPPVDDFFAHPCTPGFEECCDSSTTTIIRHCPSIIASMILKMLLRSRMKRTRTVIS